jgi:NADPH-dependent curcumin reductase CurA
MILLRTLSEVEFGSSAFIGILEGHNFGKFIVRVDG